MCGINSKVCISVPEKSKENNFDINHHAINALIFSLEESRSSYYNMQSDTGISLLMFLKKRERDW